MCSGLLGGLGLALRPASHVLGAGLAPVLGCGGGALRALHAFLCHSNPSVSLPPHSNAAAWSFRSAMELIP